MNSRKERGKLLNWQVHPRCQQWMPYSPHLHTSNILLSPHHLAHSTAWILASGKNSLEAEETEPDRAQREMETQPKLKKKSKMHFITIPRKLVITV